MDPAYVYVAAIGLLVGGGELISRYKDEPVKALISVPAAIYVLVNVGAAIAALAFLDAFKWVADDHSTKSFLLRVTIAGTGAMALFRSAVFNARVGDKDVGIGLSGLLAQFLDAADRAVDRSRATPRAQLIVRLMQDVDFTKAAAGLPAFCMALMQNVSAEEQRALGNSIAGVRDSPAPNNIKSALLGLALLNVVGEDVLRSSVDQLRASLLVEPGDAGAAPVPAPQALAAAAAPPAPPPVPGG
jgi:hypothetical protein